MVGSIIPIVHGNRSGRRLTPLALYVVSLVGTGAIAGLVLGVGGHLLRFGSLPVISVTGVLVGMACAHVLLALRELAIVQFPLPQSRWQVPRHWQVTLPHAVTMLGYGSALGVGVLTRIRGGGFYLMFVWLVILGSPAAGAIVFAAYTIGRAMPLMLVALISTGNDEVLRAYQVIDQLQPVVQVMSAMAIAASGGWVLGVALARI